MTVSCVAGTVLYALCIFILLILIKFYGVGIVINPFYRERGGMTHGSDRQLVTCTLSTARSQDLNEYCKYSFCIPGWNLDILIITTVAVSLICSEVGTVILHFTEEDTKAQRDMVTCPTLHNYKNPR